MCLRVDVYCNVYSVVRRNDVYAYVHLMRGEYDSRLVWPFKGHITIQLVNHSNDKDHCETTVLFNRIALGSGASKRVKLGERATTGSGGSIISQTFVESSNHYLINDSLTFRVTKIVVCSV